MMGQLLKYSRAVRCRPEIAALVCVFLTSCAAVKQYPDDPENARLSLAGYSEYFKASYIQTYSSASGAARTQTRDAILLNRMLAYDISYSAFKRSLAVDGSTISTGGDLAALILTGLAATTGNAATKAALAAATAGLLGARSAINTDLFYQRTLPALLAQMDANRADAKLKLLKGLGVSDAEYPLARGLMDLDELRDAGGITQAVESLTSAAVQAKTTANLALTVVHGQAFKDAFPSRQKLVDEINALTPSQVLALGAIMAANLASSLVARQQYVARLDPETRLRTDAETAYRVLATWAATEDQPADASTLTAQWEAAIVTARGK